MRVDVVGPGAVGGTLAALLDEHGDDVTVVGRGDHARRIADEGLVLARGRRETWARLDVADATRADADLVVLAVKTQDVAAAAARVTPGPGAVVVLANGLEADAIAAGALPGRRVAPGVVVFDAAHLDAGRVHLLHEGPVLVPWDAPGEVGVLDHAVTLERRRDFLGARWMKLLVNLGNGLNAATGRPAQESYRGAGARVGVELLGEGAAVARASGVRLAPLPWANPRLVAALTRLPNPVAAALLAVRVRVVFGRDPAYGSTLQSLKRGRPTEVAHLNGAVSERGQRLGIATPANDAVLAAVQRVEKGGSFTSVDELWREVRAARR